MAWVAAAAIAVLTVANVLGVAFGKSVQNLLTGAKLIGLAAVIAVGLVWSPNQAVDVEPLEPLAAPSFGLALVFVLYAYGGWNDAVFVAAEVHDQRRNVPGPAVRRGQHYDSVCRREFRIPESARTRGRTTIGHSGRGCHAARGRSMAAKAISVLVMVSALGAINGMILAGSRIYATVGEDYQLFAWLGRWNKLAGAPTSAIVLQGGISILLVFAVGTDFGRTGIDRLLNGCGLSGLPWEEYFGGFETLVAGTAPVFWAFFLLSGLAFFVLVLRHPGRQRPFSVPWFPFPPIVFCLTCVYMLYSSLEYAKLLSLLGVVPLAIGIPLYLLSRRSTKTLES